LRYQDDLASIVAGILTEPVTRTLRVAWHGAFSEERARDWITERDREGAGLLVVEKATGSPVGLIILFEIPSDDGIEVRLGYLLAEASWNLGFATELVEGLVRWCHAQPIIRSVAGGVAPDNPASRRVLEKNGFHPDEIAGEDDGSDETILRLILQRSA
jgi:RimJ/RimL family protein N-acetyltransferase